jgi:hypothetical protein
VEALSLATGKVEWDTKVPSMPLGAATVSNDLVFTTLYSGVLIALNRGTGAIVYQHQLPASTNSPIAVFGNTVLVPAGGPQTSSLNQQRWEGATGRLHGSVNWTLALSSMKQRNSLLDTERRVAHRRDLGGGSYFRPCLVVRHTAQRGPGRSSRSGGRAGAGLKRAAGAGRRQMVPHQVARMTIDCGRILDRVEQVLTGHVRRDHMPSRPCRPPRCSAANQRARQQRGRKGTSRLEAARE